MRKSIKIFLVVLGVSLVILTGIVAHWSYRLHTEIQDRLTQGWFRVPIELYSRGPIVEVGDNLDPVKIANVLQGFQEKFEGDEMSPGSFTRLDLQQCQTFLTGREMNLTTHCLALQMPDQLVPEDFRSQMFVILLGDQDTVRGFANLKEDGIHPQYLELLPTLYAQFDGEKPLLQELVQLGQVPLTCLEAITATEDSHFLDHKGVSFTGLLRAVLRNLRAGGYAQGGSTITQQLIKNYFLSPQRNLKRKIKEIVMALILENHHSKDEILQSYLNVIYMGQIGAFQVIGYGAASKYYFNKPIEKLERHECALMAAIVNSPGLFNPFLKPENAKKRRDFVLSRMRDNKMIDSSTFATETAQPLPTQSNMSAVEPSPFYNSVVINELNKMFPMISSGVRLFSRLDLAVQAKAQTFAKQHVLELESRFEKLKKNAANKVPIEVLALVVDLRRDDLIAVVGGRDFRLSQFNRAMSSKRQMGSVMKPIVYLSALARGPQTGGSFDASTVLADTQIIYKYQGQKWTPRNYDEKFRGDVPLFYALKESLNVPTARLALDVGLQNIISDAKSLGLNSSIDPLPSLSLGAFEMLPIEVATAYSSIARMGKKSQLNVLSRVESYDGVVFYNAETQQSHEPVSDVLTPKAISELISIMQETFVSGTAKAAKSMGFDRGVAAGKTGTTSDTKDAWFVGFTPTHLIVTWVGYDDNRPHGLTGASGALPLWVKIMNQTAPVSDHFILPEGIQTKKFTASEIFKTLKSTTLKESDFADVEFVTK
jgi:penicillin-binding protein 1B